MTPPHYDMESPKSALDFLLYCCLTAGTTLIGSFSLGLLGTLNDKISGVCVAVAAGMMTGCSTVLMCEAYSTSASLLVIIAGVALGVGLMLIVDRFFTANPIATNEGVTDSTCFESKYAGRAEIDSSLPTL
mmetsp:Transcript_2286/g.2238  ORF Transcript_2286/g.2238 Transcript_2286/m.2238 type:complete len:131 (+) Transcript_2286:22-414(+)